MDLKIRKRHFYTFWGKNVSSIISESQHLLPILLGATLNRGSSKGHKRESDEGGDEEKSRARRRTTRRRRRRRKRWDKWKKEGQSMVRTITAPEAHFGVKRGVFELNSKQCHVALLLCVRVSLSLPIYQ